VLGLGNQTLFGLVGIDRLELTVPNLRFPFDVSGGAKSFMSRRCDLTAAELRVDEARLQAWLDERPRLARLGIANLKVRVGGGALTLTARARVGEHEATVTARVHVASAGGQRLRLRLDDVRLYSRLPAPGPLVGLGVAFGLGAESENGSAHPITVRGVGDVTLNPLELLLWRALPPAGWRLPRYQDAALTDVRSRRPPPPPPPATRCSRAASSPPPPTPTRRRPARARARPPSASWRCCWRCPIAGPRPSSWARGCTPRSPSARSRFWRSPPSRPSAA
jgi:hypothetical protein